MRAASGRVNTDPVLAGATMPQVSNSKKITTLTDAEAPFVYFEHVPVFGTSDGLARLTLVAERLSFHDGKPTSDFLPVAHLRMSLSAVRRLRSALEKIELSLAKTPGQAN
jgi:hypothetical protein